MSDAFALMNVVGLLAFAIVGSLKGAEADLDLFGVAVLGILTALGGGIVRDTLVGQVPLALRTTTDVLVVLLGVALAVVIIRRFGDLRDHPLVVLPDAVGLAAFAATGASVGHEAGLTPFGIVVLAALTAVGGGSLCDLLLARVPVVLREDFYATPAVIGGVAFWLGVSVGIPVGIATIGCAVLVLALRLLALRRGWRLPRLPTV
ncbi:trimeric intracellular cation channel family protein [Halalkalicoccus sp. NIPERK01]|uniref:trimeric intracellular cation channel family protein n=1 Tax=Halalkalicoccus sp. NIPERK01 TaxID=3053469 RepID=UPI00256ED741|nr:TRIC cation channel family protein [Halalkalicoccus sp. NIPERK01]MDL5361952.1 TRIC cation channel family protein [Halalkalicoccus sp. NIPERK01]